MAMAAVCAPGHDIEGEQEACLQMQSGGHPTSLLWALPETAPGLAPLQRTQLGPPGPSALVGHAAAVLSPPQHPRQCTSGLSCLPSCPSPSEVPPQLLGTQRSCSEQHLVFHPRETARPPRSLTPCSRWEGLLSAPAHLQTPCASCCLPFLPTHSAKAALTAEAYLRSLLLLLLLLLRCHLFSSAHDMISIRAGEEGRC